MNMSSGGLSAKSAVSNIHGRKKATKFEKNLQEVGENLSPNELAKKKKKSRRKQHSSLWYLWKQF